jgi:hypothetical protein
LHELVSKMVALLKWHRLWEEHQKIFPCVSKGDTSNIENAGGVVELIAGAIKKRQQDYVRQVR